MRYFSAFSGIGGFEYGIQSAFNKQPAKIEQDRQRRNRTSDQVEHNVLSTGRTAPLCIGYSEIDKYAIQIYQKHYPLHKNYGNIQTIKDLPDFDLFVGGFPCQSFSIAGKRRGFDDTRGTLFFDIARICKQKQPRLLLLENVKGLLSHDQGETFALILKTLDEIGYDCQWQVLNSKDFGVPQNRERVFIIGHLRGTSRPKVFPIGENDSILDEKNEPDKGRPQTEVSHTLRGSNVKADQSFIVHNVYGGFGEKKLREFRDHSPTIRTPKGGGHIPMIVEALKEDGLEPTEKGWESLDQMGKCKIRRLTPTECERLQGFPDGWTEGISDTQRYKCLGNAVTTNVIKAIMEKLKLPDYSI